MANRLLWVAVGRSVQRKYIAMSDSRLFIATGNRLLGVNVGAPLQWATYSKDNYRGQQITRMRRWLSIIMGYTLLGVGVGGSFQWLTHSSESSLMIHYNGQQMARSRWWSITMDNIFLRVVTDPLQWETYCSESLMIHYNGQHIARSRWWSITMCNILLGVVVGPL